MSYAQIAVDFDVFKALTALRPNAETTENDVLRELLQLPDVPRTDRVSASTEAWISDGVAFPVGTRLRHRFRGGRIAEARIVAEGVVVADTTYGGLSPAALAAGGSHANGWNFWEVEYQGRWIKATALRR